MKKQYGLSLIELLIFIIIGMILMGGTIGFYIYTVRSQTENIHYTHLMQSLRSIMNLMTADVRRSSYWHNAATVALPEANLQLSDVVPGNQILTDMDSSDFFDKLGPDINGLIVVGLNGQAEIFNKLSPNSVEVNVLQSFDSNILIAKYWRILNPFSLITPSSNGSITNCLLLSYDLNNDNSVDANDLIGYRLYNNRIQTYKSGNFACDDGNWVDFSDPNINITNLSFNLDKNAIDIDAGAAGGSTVNVQEIAINIAAEIISKPQINRTLSDSVKLRNDILAP